MPLPPRKTIKITFEQYPGIEITAGSVSIETAMYMDDASAQERINIFSNALRSWNLDGDDGMPMPCTPEAFRSLEIGFATEILKAWLDAITGVPDPLDRPSTDGLPWEAASIPTETL